MCYYETYCRHCADRSTHRRAGAFRQSDASAIRFTVGTSGRHGWRNRNGLSSVRHGLAARGQYGTASRESSLAHPDETDPAKPRKSDGTGGNRCADGVGNGRPHNGSQPDRTGRGEEAERCYKYPAAECRCAIAGRGRLCDMDILQTN